MMDFQKIIQMMSEINPEEIATRIAAFDTKLDRIIELLERHTRFSQAAEDAYQTGFLGGITSRDTNGDNIDDPGSH